MYNSRRDRVQTEPNCVKYKNMYSIRLYVLLCLPLVQRAIITALAVFYGVQVEKRQKTLNKNKTQKLFLW